MEEQYKRVQEELFQQKQKYEFLMEKLRLSSKVESNDYMTSFSLKMEQQKKQQIKENLDMREKYEKELENLRQQMQQIEKEHRK